MDRPTKRKRQPRFYPPTRSFVAQALDGVEAGGVDGGDHAADDADQTQNDRRHNQAAQVDVELNISSLEVVAEGAHQWERPHGPGNYVGDGDAGEASGEGDGQGLGEKLQQDVGFVRAQRLSMPISRVRCCTETSMMFMRPMPPMPRVSAPMRVSRILSAMTTTVNSSKSCLKSAM